MSECGYIPLQIYATTTMYITTGNVINHLIDPYPFNKTRNKIVFIVQLNASIVFVLGKLGN